MYSTWLRPEQKGTQKGKESEACIKRHSFIDIGFYFTCHICFIAFKNVWKWKLYLDLYTK